MKQGSAGGNQNDFLRRFFCSNCIAFLWRSCKLRIELQKEAATLADLTSAVPHTDCGTGRQRGRIGWLIAAGILAAALLGMLVLTLADLRRAASPIVFPVEDGVYNLTAEALVTTPEDAGSFALYTNSTKLGVTIVSDAEQSGTVTLVDAATGDGIRYAAVSGRSAACEFTALTAAQRYRVSCEGFSPDAVVTISDARTVSFWHSLRAVLGELLSLLAGG